MTIAIAIVIAVVIAIAIYYYAPHRVTYRVVYLLFSDRTYVQSQYMQRYNGSHDSMLKYVRSHVDWPSSR